MKYFLRLFFGLIITTFFTSTAFAVTASWTDWTSSTSGNSASGELLVGTSTVDVEYSGTVNHSFVQTGAGTNYWTGSAYTNGAIDNAPPASELVALNQAGTVTINFSETILNPYIGLISWNSNIADFGTPIDIDSFGAGFWGSGTPILNGSGTGFTGSGEVHGIISLAGSFDSISFTHTSEGWHGFTVGVAGLAPVPVTAAIWLLSSGLMGLIGIRKLQSKTT